MEHLHHCFNNVVVKIPQIPLYICLHEWVTYTMYKLDTDGNQHGPNGFHFFFQLNLQTVTPKQRNARLDDDQ